MQGRNGRFRYVVRWLKTALSEFEPVKLHNGPAKRRSDWLDWVNKPLTEAERSAMQQRINREQEKGTQRTQLI